MYSTLINHNGSVLKRTGLLFHPFDKQFGDLLDISREYRELEFGRYTSFFGLDGANYKYSGKNHLARPMPLVLSSFRDLALERAYYSGFLKNAPIYIDLFNHILLNEYEEGQKLNAHKDDEPDLIGPIVSISLGAPANFNYGVNRNCTTSTLLEHGDILIGNKHFFDNYYHSASEPQDGVRINLTFRTVKDTISLKRS